MGTAIGVPFVAVEPRITAAVFGQHWPDALVEKAQRITIPIPRTWRRPADHRAPRRPSAARWAPSNGQETLQLVEHLGRDHRAVNSPFFTVDSSSRQSPLVTAIPRRPASR
ncbi:hypothetical protein ACF08B_30125 [Streptomyces sp. NPDC015139]|uniref:hypothetical protein n=1 Tax=Streptomyces sp. NPDC015139 TaxID=3364942 RepID=UPI00370107A5